MNVLILNWRDPKNPKSGGAEKLNTRILEVFQKKGDNITWFATQVSGLSKEENYNGIKIIRVGNSFTHFLYFPLFLMQHKFGKIDLVIDCIHGTGYFSPILLPRTKKIILICEVAKNIWDEMIAFPMSKIGKFLEPHMFRLYKKEKFWTISNSTKVDLIKFGIKNENITILPMGFDAIPVGKQTKYKSPTALFVGRLAEVKGVKDAIRAVGVINNAKGKIKWNLNIIGRGEKDYEDELRRMVSEFKIQKYVNFLGFVPERKKFIEMAKAWVLLVPSSREGWGMIVPEANYSGTPALVCNSPGLVDVAKTYSKENTIVDQKYDNIAEGLSKISKPVTIEEKIEPGWGSLQQFLSEYEGK